MRNVLPCNHPNCCSKHFQDWWLQTCGTTSVPPSHKLRWRGMSPFSSCPVTFRVRSHRTSTRPLWNHNPRSYLVPSGSPGRQGSATDFCKRETSVVWMLRGGKDMGKPTFSNSTGSDRAADYLPWCRLRSWQSCWPSPPSQTSPNPLAHDNPLLRWWPRVSIPWSPFLILPPPPQEGSPISVYSLFLLLFWCEYLSSGENNNHKKPFSLVWAPTETNTMEPWSYLKP